MPMKEIVFSSQKHKIIELHVDIEFLNCNKETTTLILNSDTDQAGKGRTVTPPKGNIGKIHDNLEVICDGFNFQLINELRYKKIKKNSNVFEYNNCGYKKNRPLGTSHCAPQNYIPLPIF